MAGNERVELLGVVGGTTAVTADGVEQVIARIRTEQSGTAVVHHDLRDVSQGVVRRLRLDRMDHTTVLELAHGCVCCTLRENVLPLLRERGRLQRGYRANNHAELAECGDQPSVAPNRTPSR